ncbi:ABC transporter ATP-binding protein [Roseomonas aerophila]|uniref:ABC transporter ATP-binding protein n=1 Tax=Teichococcus aerophilus TaxID=1224513 RepID=A0ABR7RG58_9PROT|nr:ABC transporter ATP-binding protein [Pseudoroseomonas aerophila]MBC9205551.1 ABC transporter ATP-binding protein [Pseudoroseomonas aerophila]
MSRSSPHLRLEQLVRHYAGAAAPAVDRISLDLPRGALLALLGPSGCGKTTTLRMIAGLEKPESGRILVGGRDVTALPPHKRHMGVVFQSYALFPHMTSVGNVAFGLEMQGVARAERGPRALAALELVGLSGFAQRKPRQLSGGQQQRVALARALAIEPDLLLLDEPLSALDAKLREGVRDEIRALQQRLGTTAVFVTHDQTEALAMADLVAVMNAGKVEQLAAPEEIFERPATRFVATFVGRAARIQGRLEAGGVLRTEGGAALRTHSSLAAGPVEAFLRPHRVRLLAPGEAAPTGMANVLDATLARRVYTGEIVALEANTPAGVITAELHAGTDGLWRELQPGSPMRLAFRDTDLLVFPAP